MGVPENINALLYRFDIKQEALARIAGVSQAAVSGWVHGKKPSNASLRKICEYFSLEPNDILSDALGLAKQPVHGLDKQKIKPRNGGLATLPLYGYVHAGDSEEPFTEEDVVELPSTVAENHPDGYFLKVRGNCMDKVYPEGCYILVDPMVEPHNGSIVCAQMDDGAVVMRRMFKGANTLVLSPDSHSVEYADIVFSGEDIAEVRCLGTVVWYQARKEMD